MFKEAVIHFPTDENAQAQISKELAVFHRIAVTKHMDTLKLSERQKLSLIDSVLQDMRQNTSLMAQQEKV